MLNQPLKDCMYKTFFYSTKPLEIPIVNFSDMDNSHILNIKKENVATLNHCTQKDIYLFAFKKVEPHIDGNGLSSFWLMSGEGDFYFPDENKSVHMKAGDIILFDDHVEHGFNSHEICLGLSLMWKNEPEQEQIETKINDFLLSQDFKINLKNQKKLKKFKF